jgi:hypothetical membrane protein
MTDLASQNPPDAPTAASVSARTRPADGAAWMGAAAALVFVGTVIVGGTITPGYSHIGNAVSELVETGAPYRAVLNVGFAAYNLLIIGFALDLFRRALASGSVGVTTGAGLLVGMAVAGLAMVPFAMDPIGAPMTVWGIGHIILAGLASLSAMGSLLAFTLGLRSPSWGRPWAGYAALSLAVTFVTGAVAAASAVGLWPTMGLWERITIGAQLQWVFAFALARATGRLPR